MKQAWFVVIAIMASRGVETTRDHNRPGIIRIFHRSPGRIFGLTPILNNENSFCRASSRNLPNLPLSPSANHHSRPLELLPDPLLPFQAWGFLMEGIATL